MAERIEHVKKRIKEMKEEYREWKEKKEREKKYIKKSIDKDKTKTEKEEIIGKIDEEWTEDIGSKDNLNLIYIDIDDLDIDDFNIRKAISVDDVQPMVKSVKEQGIIQNLIVRPARYLGENKYSIICGSRRYQAAIKADFKKLPCKILDVDDITAMGISLIENEGRVNIPTWRTIEWIGEMARKIESQEKIRDKAKIVEKLAEKSAYTSQTIKRYLKIDKLYPKVKILLKPHEERTLEEKEIIKKYIPYDYKKVELSIGVAELIIRNLMILSEEQLFIHSLRLSEYSYEKANEIIKELKKNPKKSIDEIEELIISDSNTRVKTIAFKRDLYEKLENMTVRRKKKLDKLIIDLIEEGLKYY